MNKITNSEVWLWGTCIGYVSWNSELSIAEFQYDESFVDSKIEVAPLTMPLSHRISRFLNLDKNTYKGLPGFLADSLPDKFGNKLIEEWLVRQGRELKDFSPVERLCYIGQRGVGALEYVPSKNMTDQVDDSIALDEMVKLASKIISDKKKKKGSIQDNNLLSQILMIGTSAGGARAKCLVAYNEITGELRSGQVNKEEGYTYWLMKLDGVDQNSDKEDPDPQGFSKIEYAYYLMAKDCGIEMSLSRLLKEGKRSHFMTKRFDRLPDGSKVHMQSLCAIAHYDFNYAGAYSYEQSIDVINKIIAPSKRNLTREQMFLRAVYNVVGRNQDDHTKNISFLMNKAGSWRLSPAYDLTYSYNPNGEWTSSHQMKINGKRNDITREDLLALARFASIKKGKANNIVDKVIEVFSSFKDYAQKADVDKKHIKIIQQNLRLNL